MNKERVYYIKPFTKAWFINIWYHYKIAIIFILIAAVLLGIFIYDKVTEVKYDLTVLYIGDKASTTGNDLADLKTKLDSVVPDINGDGKYQTNCRSIFVSSELAESEDYVATNMTQADLEVSSGQTLVFLFGGGYEQPYVGDGKSDDSMCDLTELAKKYGYEDSQLKKYPDGRVYAISMKDNPLLNFDASDVYIVMFPPTEDNEENAKKFDAAKQIVEYMVSRGEYEIKR